MMKICLICSTEEDLEQFRLENDNSQAFRGPVKSKDTFLDKQDFLYLAILTKSIKGYDRYLFDQVILANDSIVIDESILRMVSESMVPDDFKIQILKDTSVSSAQLRRLDTNIETSLKRVLPTIWF